MNLDDNEKRELFERLAKIEIHTEYTKNSIDNINQKCTKFDEKLDETDKIVAGLVKGQRWLWVLLSSLFLSEIAFFIVNMI